MKKLLLVSLSLGAILFSSCQKEEPVRCILPNTPKINMPNTKFFTGETIELKAIDYSDLSGLNVLYKWSGPNGFHSEMQNPVILNATTQMSGEYKLVVSKGICESPEVTTNIDVIVNTVTCTPINNNIVFSGYLADSNFYNIVASGYEYGYNLGANDQYTNLDIDFSTAYETKPQSGIYSIVDKDAALTNSTVHVKVSDYSPYTYSTTYFYAKSGNVKISYVAGKMYAVFCYVPFSRTTTTDFTASSKITEE
jgi:hypothetical protein